MSLAIKSLMSKLRSFNRIELTALAFYLVSGIILLVFLPLTDYPPQLAFIGILSIIATYGIYSNRFWSPYVLFVLFIAALTFSLFTLFSAGFSNVLLGITMIAYAVLIVVFTVYILVIRRKPT